jgi:hypothetical protein
VLAIATTAPHAAERATGDGREPLDPEHIEKRALGAHHVGDGDHREVGAVGPAGSRIHRSWPGAAAAASEQVSGDDVVAIGVERLARTDHPVPPAESLPGLAVTVIGAETVSGAARCRVAGEAGGMRVAAEGMADEDHIVPLG